uniref:Uncharacterized protein n=1 Tax=Arundo donax TaxID=35708 RepID=A0A0A9HBV3_ARUDO
MRTYIAAVMSMMLTAWRRLLVRHHPKMMEILSLFCRKERRTPQLEGIEEGVTINTQAKYLVMKQPINHKSGEDPQGFLKLLSMRLK